MSAKKSNHLKTTILKDQKVRKKGLLDQSGTPLPVALSEQPKRSRLGREVFVRVGLALVFFVLAFVMKPWVPRRFADPGSAWFVLEPMIGLLLFWPLSGALRKSMPLFWAMFLASTPAAVLIGVRLWVAQRQTLYGLYPNISYGVMVFVGISSMAMYLLFGHRS